MFIWLALIPGVIAELSPFMQSGPPITIGRPLTLAQKHPLQDDRHYARVVLMMILIGLLGVSLVWTGATYGWIKSKPTGPSSTTEEKAKDLEASDPLMEAVRSFDRQAN